MAGQLNTPFFDAALEGVGGAKHPDALKLERLVAKWIRAYKADKSNFTAPKELGQHFGKMFNTSPPTLVLIPEPTALTLPLHLIAPFKSIPATEVTKSGMIRFKKKQSMSMKIVLGTTLFNQLKLTPGEMTAVLLHETGHNFYDLGVFLRLIKLFFFALLIRDLVNRILRKINSSTQTENAFDDVWKIVKKNIGRIYAILDDLNSLYTFPTFGKKKDNRIRLNHPLDWYKTTKRSIRNMRQLLFLLGLTGVGVHYLWSSYALGALDHLATYPQEEFADNFASSLGYGVELASGLAKLGKFSQREYAVLDLLNIVNEALQGILNFGTTSHPSILRRITLVRKYLEKSAKTNSVDKKVIAENLKALKMVEDDYKQSLKERPGSFVVAHTGNLMDQLRTVLAKILAKETDPVKLAVRND